MLKLSIKISKITTRTLQDQHFDYAYCITAHQAQGQTKKHAILHLESTSPKLTTQQLFYVGVSRAKDTTIVITDDKEKLIQKLEINTGKKTSAIKSLEKSRGTLGAFNTIAHINNSSNLTNIKNQFNEIYKKEQDRFLKFLPSKDYTNYRKGYLNNLHPKIKKVLEKNGTSFINNLVRHHIIKQHEEIKNKAIKTFNDLNKGIEPEILNTIIQKRQL